VPDEVRAAYASVAERGSAAGDAWDEQYRALASQDPKLAGEYRRAMQGELPENWAKDLVAASFEDAGSAATRQSSGQAINLVAPRIPELIGGSADLAASNLTTIADGG